MVLLSLVQNLCGEKKGGGGVGWGELGGGSKWILFLLENDIANRDLCIYNHFWKTQYYACSITAFTGCSYKLFVIVFLCLFPPSHSCFRLTAVSISFLLPHHYCFRLTKTSKSYVHLLLRCDRKCLFSCIYNPQITITPLSSFPASFNGNRVKNHPKPWTCP